MLSYFREQTPLNESYNPIGALPGCCREAIPEMCAVESGQDKVLEKVVAAAVEEIKTSMGSSKERTSQRCRSGVK